MCQPLGSAVVDLHGCITVARAECGVSTMTESSLLVVNGEEAKPNSWPWQISLRERSFWFGDQHMCGGSLITDQWIVTAAHCVDGKEYSYFWNIWLGAHDVNSLGNAVPMSPSKIIKHSGFNMDPPTSDIALIKLSNPVSLTSSVNTVCLPSKTYTSGYGYVTGWGDTLKYGIPGMYPDKLQQVKTPIMDHSVCNSIMKEPGSWYDPVDDTMICAGYSDQEKGSCSGDSGGPFVVKNSAGKWELAGVVSWGLNPCAQKGVPTVYTDVFYFKNWIATNIANN